MRRIFLALRRFRRAEDGHANIGSISVLIMILLAGGTAVEIANAWRVREILQSTAEAAAYSAAIRASEPRLAETPRGVARETSRDGLEVYRITDAWQSDSFTFGRVPEDGGAAGFVPGLSEPNAVRVTLRRSAARGNAHPLVLLRIFGFDPWTIRGSAVATFETKPAVRCEDPLLSLQARVDVSAENAFVGICLYANAQVEYGDRPVWKDHRIDALINDLLVGALGLPSIDLFGLTGVPTRDDLDAAVASATENIRIRDLDRIAVLSDGRFRIDCEDRDVVRFEDGFVIENAAVFSDCPIRFGTDVQLRAALVVSDLTSVLTNLPEVRVAPDAILTGSPPCMQGDGLKVLLFADLDIVSDIPALVSVDSPLGAYLDDTVARTGGLLGDVQDTLGGLLGKVSKEVTDIATSFTHLPVCLGLDVMLDRNTIALR